MCAFKTTKIVLTISFGHPYQTPVDCDGLLEENAEQKAEIKWLNDIITNNISNLNALIQDNSDLIDLVNGRATINEAHIAQNKRRIDENQANMNALDENVDALDVKVKEDEARLETLAVKVEELHEAPLGSITAWVTRPSSVGGTEASLPSGWQKCDGSLIPAPSIWEGKVTPNLNGERRFLRGGSDSDMLKLEEDQVEEHTHKLTDPGHKHPFTDRYTDNNENHNGPKDGNGVFGSPHPSETASGFSGSIMYKKEQGSGLWPTILKYIVVQEFLWTELKAFTAVVTRRDPRI